MTTTEVKPKLISTWLNEPSKKSEYAYKRVISCHCPTTCPVHEEGKCIHAEVLSSCIYGKQTSVRSPSTQRGKAYRPFVDNYKEDKKINPEHYPSIEGYYTHCIRFIGDYVYLPYAHMNHMDNKKNTPFGSHSNIFSSGSKFMKREDFTPEVIVSMCKFKPHVLMDGEITSYQKKVIPLFLFHLKHLHFETYKEACALDESLSGKTFELGEEYKEKPLKALLKHISPHVTDGYVLDPHGYVLSWDGIRMSYTGKHEELFKYQSLSGIKAKEGSTMMISFAPDVEKTKIIINDDTLKEIVLLNNPELLENFIKER
tara:strand:+ start:1643 stop:2584 length:942 start_codon:yes stop_codon:yes gene_type:complete